MKPQRDILDFVNTGANVLQAVKLSEINTELRSMARTEAAKEQRAQLQRHLRQTLIDQEEVIEAASESVQSNPGSAYAQGRLVRYLFEKAEFKPSLFEAWDDIDRAKSVIKKLDMVIDRAVSQVPKDFANEVTECLRFTEEVSQLEEVIILSRQRDEVVARKNELEELERKLQQLPGCDWCRHLDRLKDVLILLATCSGIGIIICYFVGMSYFESAGDYVLLLVPLAFMIVFGVGAVAVHFVQGIGPGAEYQRLMGKIEVERAFLLSSPVDTARITALAEKFGGDGPHTKFVGIAENRSKRWRQVFSSVPLDRPPSLESS